MFIKRNKNKNKIQFLIKINILIKCKELKIIYLFD